MNFVVYMEVNSEDTRREAQLCVRLGVFVKGWDFLRVSESCILGENRPGERRDPKVKDTNSNYSHFCHAL